MPNAHTQFMFHFVFSTKNREQTLTDGYRESLFLDERRRLLTENRITLDEQYLA